VAIFERWGFTWGGRWLVLDGMHFELLSQRPPPLVLTPSGQAHDRFQAANWSTSRC
jgi:D-alanyl-D-alanine carboxypeptidase